MSEVAAIVRPATSRRGAMVAKKNGSNGSEQHDLLVKILDRLDEVEVTIRRDLREFRQAWAAGYLDHEARLQRIEKILALRR